MIGEAEIKVQRGCGLTAKIARLGYNWTFEYCEAIQLRIHVRNVT